MRWPRKVSNKPQTSVKFSKNPSGKTLQNCFINKSSTRSGHWNEQNSYYSPPLVGKSHEGDTITTPFDWKKQNPILLVDRWEDQTATEDTTTTLPEASAKVSLPNIFRGCDLKHRWSLDLESLLNFHYSSPTDYCIYCFSFICTSTPCIQPNSSDLRWQNLLWSMNCMICLEWSCVGWLRCVDWLFRPLFKSPSHDFTSRSFGKAQE